MQETNTKSNALIDAKEELSRLVEKKVFSPLDSVTFSLSFSSFVDSGVVRCEKSIETLAETIEACLFKCKHPGLNPCIDKIFEYKKKDNDVAKEAILLLIEEEGSFETKEIDNNNDFLEITLELEVLVVNMETFLKEKSLKIKKASVQTALFKKEIG